MIDKKGKRPTSFIDRTGMTFGRLTVVERVPRPPYHSQGGAWWRCKCSCGNEVIVSGTNLHSQNTRSCGCLLKETALAKLDHARRCRWKRKDTTS